MFMFRKNTKHLMYLHRESNILSSLLMRNINLAHDVPLLLREQFVLPLPPLHPELGNVGNAVIERDDEEQDEDEGNGTFPHPFTFDDVEQTEQKEQSGHHY